MRVKCTVYFVFFAMVLFCERRNNSFCKRPTLLYLSVSVMSESTIVSKTEIDKVIVNSKINSETADANFISPYDTKKAWAIKIDLNSDPNHCGCIGVSCMPGQVNYLGACCDPKTVPTQKDNKTDYCVIPIYDHVIVDDNFMNLERLKDRAFYVVSDVRSTKKRPPHLQKDLTGNCIQWNHYLRNWILLGQYKLFEIDPTNVVCGTLQKAYG
jgi:hypothetical protein